MSAPTVGLALEARIFGKGKSSSRDVFHYGDWVYKFDVGEDEEGWKPQEQNRVEWETYLYLTEHPETLPEGTGVPEIVLLEADDTVVEGGCIVASRYVEVVSTIPDCEYWADRCHCYGKREWCWWEAMCYGGPLIEDLWGNVYYDKQDTYWLLDLGYGSTDMEVST